MKNRPEVAEFHVDGQTDMTKLIVTFLNFAKASNMLRQMVCSFFMALYWDQFWVGKLALR